MFNGNGGVENEIGMKTNGQKFGVPVRHDRVLLFEIESLYILSKNFLHLSTERTAKERSSKTVLIIETACSSWDYPPS